MVSTADKRRSTILERIARNPLVTVNELSDLFNVSAVLIRRDLEQLEKLGLLKRVHGGAVAASEGAMGNSYNTKIQRHSEEKERIGRAAAQFVQDGDHIMFDASTTALHVAKYIPACLPNNGKITVITASLPVILELGNWKNIHLISLGGIYLPDYKSFIGPQTLDNLRGLRSDKVFLGTDGFTLDHGVTGANLLEIEVNRAMANAAAEIIVVTDSSKIGGNGLASILPLNRVSKLVTDTKAPLDFVVALRNIGVEVILV